MLYPKLFTTIKTYSLRAFAADLTAGIVVGVVALPLAIAFAIASGVSPEKGLITAIVAGFLISSLGGSRIQIGGPTGAFVVIVYSIVHQHGVQGLTIATLLAGILLMIMGAARLGSVIKFVPHPVVVGFTSGIAVIIFSSQAKDFLGLSTGALPADFIHKWRIILQNAGSANPWAVGIAIFTILLISVWPRVLQRIPGSLVAIVLASLAVRALHLPVETIGSRFGTLPTHLPAPHWPQISFADIQRLIQPAFTIAILCAIESLLSAVVADGMIGGRHRSNMELVAQGVANVGSALFGGIPATGAIARTATNAKNGGRTPVAGLVHALTLLLIMLFFGKWAELIPLACLAGILTVVAYHMSEWRSFLSLLKGIRSDMAVMAATFLLTVFIDLTVAIEVGMVLAAFLFMHRMAAVTNINIIAHELEEEELEDVDSISRIKVPKGIEVFEINGPFFFGVSHEFEETVRIVAKKPKVRILRLRNVPVIDASGVHALRQFHARCRKDGIRLFLSGIQPQPMEALSVSGLLDEIGPANIAPSIHESLRSAQAALGQ